MRHTPGQAELYDPDVRCLVAVGPDRTVHGITSWMPVYAGGRPVGWTIDFMRRSAAPSTCRGVMEFLIATAALAFRTEGARFVSLSAASLARMDRNEQPCAIQGLLDIIGTATERCTASVLCSASRPSSSPSTSRFT